jgi:nitrogenase molybdenum-iron protein alpha/beta subunit
MVIDTVRREKQMPLKCYEHCCSSCIALANLGKIEGVIPILHGPQACAFGNQMGSMFCRPSRLLTVGTTLKKSEVIFGGEENLKQQIINVYHQYTPKIIVIISTCVPQLIGEDVKGIITELQEQIPELKVTYCETGFNHPRSTPMGNDVSWKAIVDVLEPQEMVKNSVGLLGRAGQDADSLGTLTALLREVPAGHLDEMAKIVKAEYLCPIQLVPHLTCRRLSERFGSAVRYFEIPAGVEGTSRFLRGVADLTDNQNLAAIIEREEARVVPRLRTIQARFKEERVRALLVTGPSNEMSIGKILAEFGAEVIIVPAMRNAFARQEQTILRERYGARITFHEGDFDTVAKLADLYKPDVVFADFQARVELVHRLVPCLINENYLNEYGYDYAIDFGEHFFETLGRPVLKEWRDLVNRYGEGRYD